MAVLQKIRNRAGLLIGVLGLALLAFILSDLFTSSNTFFRKYQDKAFTVDGEVVSTGDFQSRIDQYDAFFQLLYGQAQSGETAGIASRERVYREMVEQMMLDKEAEKLGLSVTAEEMSELIYGSNVSTLFFYDENEEISRMFVNPQTGRFDQAMLTNYLSFIAEEPTSEEQKPQVEQARYAWSYVNDRIKYQRLKEKYSSLISRTMLANDEEAKAVFNDSKNTADFVYVMQPYSALADSTVEVSDSEMKALYEKRKKNFKLDSELATISYYVKDIIPSDDDYAQVKKEMDVAVEKLKNAENPGATVNEYSSSPYFDAYIAMSVLGGEEKNFIQSASVGDVYGPVRDEQAYIAYKYVDRIVAPDSISLQQIPMPTGLDQAAIDMIADSLLNVVHKGKDFVAVADEMWPGSDVAKARKVTEADLAMININKQCFAAAKGDILKLVINGRTSLIRISDKDAPVAKVKLATVIMPVVVSDKTQNAIDNELNQFISEHGNVENFDKGARSKGYGLMSEVLLAPSFLGLDQIEGNTRSVIHWAFNNKIGEVSKFDLTDKKIVAIISNRIDGDYRPLSEPMLNNILKSELIKDKKADKMIADLKAKNLTSLDAYAQAVESKIDSVKFVSFETKDSEPLFNAYSKQGKANQLTAPLKGRNGVYALYITDKMEVSKEYDVNFTKMQLMQESSYILRQSALYILREKMNVKDNRVKFW